MKKITSPLALILALALLFSLCACGTAGSSAEAAQSAASAPEAAATEPEVSEEAPAEQEAPEEAVISAAEPEAEPEPEPELEYSLPLEDNSVSLSYWISWNPDLAAVCAAQDASVYRALEEQTGVRIEYIESSPFNQGQDFDLMIASGDYVDIFPASGNLSVEEAFEQDISIDLTGFMDTYLRDYYGILETNDAYMSAAKTSDDQFLGVISMYGENVAVNCGLVIRKDWLDQLNLELPETYDDYYNVLTAFKVELGAASPMHLGSYGVLNGNYFCSGYGINGYISNMDAPFYQVDGEVRFGPIQPEFKDYLTMMNQWYSEGLVYSDFYSVQDPMTAPSDQVTTNNMGLWICELARMHEFDSQFAEGDSFELWPVPDAVQNAGDVNKIRVATELAGGGGEVIASTCQYPEIAALWLNYRYTEEGILLLNYGVEGEGFTYNDAGEPELTELITGAENINFGLAMYATVFLGFSQPERMFSTYSDAQTASLEVWKMGDNEYSYPSNASMTTEETEIYSGKFSDINTYLQGEVVKFITGERSLDTFEDFVSTIESMDIAACVAQRQAALDRYLS